MSSENILAQLKETYLAGIPNHLEEMESYILSMEKGSDYQENFEALYRKAHSLKGSGGTYGFSIITSICHQMEDYISDALQDSTSVNQQAIDIIFGYIDIIKETHELLLNNTEDFSDIEDKLKKLKKSTFSQGVNGLVVDEANNVYSQICIQVLASTKTHYTTTDSGMAALQRLLHEHFDFLITFRENTDLNGPALIAALKLNQKKGKKLKTILITSNPPTDTCNAIKSDYIVLKNKSFDANLSNAIENIKNDR
ncbi:MAG: Hpt domain-containing protein [Gammaproteobacteria bacterium]|nr:Hpt domain-containing protein [Gammaproteobacteria bacterium]